MFDVQQRRHVMMIKMQALLASRTKAAATMPPIRRGDKDG